MRQRENPSSHQNDRRKRLNSSEFDWDTGNGAYASNARTSDRQNPYREDQIRQTQIRQNTNRQNPNRQAPDRQAQSRQAQSRQAQSRQAKSGYAQSEYAQNRYAQSGQSDERRVQSRQSQPERNPYDDYQRKAKGQKKNKHTIGKIIALIQAALSLIVLGVLFVLDVLPMMYIGVLAALLVFLWLFAFFSQYTKKSHIPGKIFSLIMCALLALAGYYLLVTKNMLSQITNYA